MSLAQIELMAADRPVTVYPKKDRVEMGGGRFREFDRPDPRDLREANEHWARMLAERERKKNKTNQTHGEKQTIPGI